MHKLTNINKVTKTADCAICGQVRIKLRGLKKNGELRGECINVIKAQQSSHYKYNPAREMKKTYGLSDQQLLDWQQATICDCCGEPRSTDSKQFHIDHCHATGKVRGFLCRDCNFGIGFFKNSTTRLQSAIGYLERSNPTAANP